MIESGSRPVIANGVWVGLARQFEELKIDPTGDGQKAWNEDHWSDKQLHLGRPNLNEMRFDKIRSISDIFMFVCI